MGVKSAQKMGQKDTLQCGYSLGVGTAVPLKATTGQKPGSDARPGGSPCSLAPQQHVLAEVKGFTPKSGATGWHEWHQLCPDLHLFVP